jgi:hypothetical protein
MEASIPCSYDYAMTHISTSDLKLKETFLLTRKKLVKAEVGPATLFRLLATGGGGAASSARAGPSAGGAAAGAAAFALAFLRGMIVLIYQIDGYDFIRSLKPRVFATSSLLIRHSF